jgi:hypothetical protein
MRESHWGQVGAPTRELVALGIVLSKSIEAAATNGVRIICTSRSLSIKGHRRPSEFPG